MRDFFKLVVPTVYEPTIPIYNFFSLDIYMNLTSLKGFQPKKTISLSTVLVMPDKWPIYLLGTVEEGSSKTGFWIKISPKWLLHIMSHMDITWSENLFWIYIFSNKKYAMKTSWTTIMSRGDKIHIIHQGGPNYGAHIISSPFKSVSWCFGMKIA